MRRRGPAASADQIDAGFDKGFPEGRKILRRHIEHRLFADQSWHTGIGFGKQGNPGPGFHGGNQGHHAVGSGRAVAAHRIRAETLQGNQGGHRIRPVERTAILLVGHGDHRKQIGRLPDGDQGRPRLLNVHHGFNHEQINTTLQKSPNLLLEGMDSPFKFQVAEGLDKMAGGTDIAGDESFPAHGRPCQQSHLLVDLPHIFDAILAEFETVGPESAGIDDFRSGLCIGPVNLLNHFRMIEAPDLRTDTGRHPALLEFRSRRSIQDQDLFLQKADYFCFFSQGCSPHELVCFFGVVMFSGSRRLQPALHYSLHTTRFHPIHHLNYIR